MVTVGFIVEGPSDKIVVQSQGFLQWLDQYGICLAMPIVVAGGHGSMRSERIDVMARNLRKQSSDIDKVVLLADLDPDENVRCITERKALVHSDKVDLVVIARKAIEAWFLADSSAMRDWTKDPTFFERRPEETSGTAWGRLKEIGKDVGRGPGTSKVAFAKRFAGKHGFTIRDAAKHPNCPSAVYFTEHVSALGGASL